MDSSQAIASFVRGLHWALQHLYDTGELARSPLLEPFGLHAEDGVSSLRDILLEGIAALRPDASVPPENRGWRTYNALYYRYVDQFPQREVAKALGLSVRQLRRQEHLAMRLLSDRLWVHHGLGAKLVGPAAEAAAAKNQVHPDRSQMPSREQEIRWLERSLPSEPVVVSEMIEAMLKTIGPLLSQLGVGVECEVATNLPRLAVRRAVARQALLNTLTASARAASGGRMRIRAQAQRREICIDIQALGPANAAGCLPAACSESLEMARRLAELSGGSLRILTEAIGDAQLAVRLSLPVAQQASVMVVDDNVDTLQLFDRYLADTPYACMCCRDPDHALVLAQELRPSVIILDVMLPGVDGWEILGRLREDPDTHDIPVIVCTILAEEQLALALGAAEFMRKPISRVALLAAVDRQAGRQPQRSVG